MKTNLQQKNNSARNRKNKLLNKFEEWKKNQRQVMAQIEGKILNYNIQKGKIDKQLKDFTKKNGKFEKKYEIIKEKNKKIWELKEKIRQEQESIKVLKKSQTEGLKKYKESVAHKMNYDQSLNKNAERKLKQFVQKLKKII